MAAVSTGGRAYSAELSELLREVLCKACGRCCVSPSCKSCSCSCVRYSCKACGCFCVRYSCKACGCLCVRTSCKSCSVREFTPPSGRYMLHFTIRTLQCLLFTKINIPLKLLSSNNKKRKKLFFKTKIAIRIKHEVII